MKKTQLRTKLEKSTLAFYKKFDFTKVQSAVEEAAKNGRFEVLVDRDSRHAAKAFCLKNGLDYKEGCKNISICW